MPEFIDGTPKIVTDEEAARIRKAATSKEQELIQRLLRLRLDGYKREGVEFVPLDDVEGLMSAMDELQYQLETEKGKTEDVAQELRDAREEFKEMPEVIKKLVRMVLEVIANETSNEEVEAISGKVDSVLSLLRKVPGKESEISRRALETLRGPQLELIVEQLTEAYDQLVREYPWIEDEGEATPES